MATTEPTINDALAALLRKTRHTWRAHDVIRSENTGMLRANQKKPDILVIEPNVSPVIIETEILPAVTVEKDALVRLGERLRHTGRPIMSALAVRLPTRLRSKQGLDLEAELEKADDFSMAIFTGSDPSKFCRWPRTGWISGSILDLSIFVQSASVPPEIIDQAADELVVGVSEAAGLLQEISRTHPGAIQKIGEALHQEGNEQTQRMAATILANALVFQETLAGGPGELATVKSLEELKSSEGVLRKASILAEWRKILTVNYWPIFNIARQILEVIPTEQSQFILEGLGDTADRLLQHHLMRSHDLTGAVFQRLIADRKFLAAYYTTPASAALLVGLSITPEGLPAGGKWKNTKQVTALRIADFACGTGTLLSTAYHRVGQFHEIAGGNSEKLHPQMMASVFVGCDVLPAAAHLTASMLAGAHPTTKYQQSSILTVPYGKQDGNTIALGSLDLLDLQGTLFANRAKIAESMGEAETETWQSLPNASFDVVIMNPPFTRATGQEGKKIGVPNPMFAAFSSTAEEQKLMGKAIKRLTNGTSAHGNAGEASIFLVLADRKLKPRGILALVMPLSLMSGEAWEASRALLNANYSDLILISIAGRASTDFSFSADTGMGECLVVGRKVEKKASRATFVILNEQPAFSLLGTSIARQIRQLIVTKRLRRLEDGPVGGTPLRFGDEIIGQALSGPLPNAGGWNLARISDLSLGQTAYQLANNGRIWLPRMKKSEAIAVPMTTVGKIGKIGPYHSDIDGITQTGSVRGPFQVCPRKLNAVPTYPVLWSHDAKKQQTMAFDADCEGNPRQGKDAKEQESVDIKIANIWDTASHCHFNRDFQFNSQATGMQFTPHKTMGGRAWLSISLSSVDQEKALILWANTSLGALLHWWHANKQQSGRGNISKMALELLPILDVTKLDSDSLQKAVDIFDSTCDQKLAPLHELDVDAIRSDIDTRFVRDVLNLSVTITAANGPLELLRSKLAKEPSIRGTK